MTLAPQNCRDAWRRMCEMSRQEPVRNFIQLLDMSDFLVETDLFPAAALNAYSALNMEKELTAAHRKFINDERGGAQGSYRDGMAKKIANVVDCLTHFPQSKRAVISFSNAAIPDHRVDADAKCVRELHLYLDDDGRLSGTMYLRAQAASLFPKNIHMIGSIMSEVASALPGQPDLGMLFYVTTLLVADRS